MKKNNLIAVLSTWLVFSLPLLALAGAAVPNNPMAQRALDRYASMKNIEGRCTRNAGARVDTEAGSAYKSACIASYKRAQEIARKYIENEKQGVAKIQALTSQNTSMCGANRATDSQRSCFESVARGYDEAAAIKEKLSKDLLNAYKEAQELRDQNAVALKKYRADQKAIEDAIKAANTKAQTYREFGELQLAQQTEKSVQSAATVNAGQATVSAANGAESSISGYKQKIDSLAREQVDAQKNASDFANDTKSQAYTLQKQSTQYRQKADDIRKLIRDLPSAGAKESGIGQDAKLPEKGPVPNPRPGNVDSGGSTADSSGPAGGSGQSRADATTGGGAETDGSRAPASQDTGTGGGNSSAGSGNSMTGIGNAAGAAGAFGGAAGGSMSGKSETATPDPYAGLASPPNYSGPAPDQPAAATNDKIPPATNLGTYKPGNDDTESDTAEDTTGPETKVEEIPEEVAATGGLSGDTDSESSGASSAPGIRNADGKPIGFSSASGGRLGSGDRGDREEAAKEQFVSNLTSGAVSIAGSDVKSAMANLAEELGAEDLDLDLDLGDLTAEEKAALAPIDTGMNGNKSVSVAGRRTASALQGSDESIQDVESLALFARNRSALERAQKRGNLILGIKKKF